MTGHVTALRQLPLRSSCSGTFEAEGIDYDRRTGTLRVIVVSPGFCVLTDSKPTGSPRAERRTRGVTRAATEA